MSVRGIDISAWQGNPDLGEVARAGYRFVYVKATEGLSYRSPRFAPEFREAGEVGLLRGGYHFFHPHRDPRQQASRFVAELDAVGHGELPPALDVEAFSGMPKLEPDRLCDAVLTCLDSLERQTGQLPVLYTGPSFWKYRLGRARHASELRRYPLWWASYTRDASATDPPRPPPWEWAFWQRSGSGRVPGVRGNCDLDVFAGDELQLVSLGRAA